MFLTNVTRGRVTLKSVEDNTTRYACVLHQYLNVGQKDVNVLPTLDLCFFAREIQTLLCVFMLELSSWN